MKNKIGVITIYSLCHFIVDFVSAVFVLGKLPQVASNYNQLLVAIIIYNFFAFAFQVPIGCLLDKFKVYKYISIIGFCLIGICYLANVNNVFLLATIVGIGNALFHLEGGINIYGLSKRKAFLNGLFVAPGALGIFLGTTFRDELIVTYLPVVLIILAIVLLILVQGYGIEEKLKSNIKGKYSKGASTLIVILIGLSIIVRAIGGSAIIYTWKTGFVLGLLYTISVMIGKAFGGLIADKYGMFKVATISLATSAICLILGYNIHIFAYIGIMLFNIPMSITLTILENTLSKNIACAVGLNTMFSFIGFIISFIDITINNNIILIASIILVILSIYFANRLYLRGVVNDEKN